MSLPSLHQQTGLSILLGNILAGDTFVPPERLTETLTAYDHQIDAVGGFRAATIAFNRSITNVVGYLTKTLGRRVNTYNSSNKTSYRGFVNQVNISLAGLSYSIGPLMDVRNRAMATYTPVDYNVDPPTTGAQTFTLINQDLSSQQRFGIIDGIINVGKCPDFWADQSRDVYLKQYAEPGRPGDSLSIMPGAGGDASVSLDCLGISSWLSAYIYQNASTGLSILSDKIKAVLAADPNGFISTNYRKIETNLFLANDYEEGDRFAWDILFELLGLGDDVTDRRVVFGIYEDDVPVYSEMPTGVEYIYRLSDQARRIRDLTGATVLPWDVRPGKYLFVPDFMPGSVRDFSNINVKDPRVKFLESVRYSAPYSLDLSGNMNDELSQLLAKITYTGGMM